MDIEQLIFNRKHRVTRPAGHHGDGTVQARQLDAVLMTLGFKCSGGLLAALGAMHPAYVIDKAVQVIGWARELSGAHRQHNTYFIDFPRNVPDTEEFWMSLIEQAVRERVGVRGGVAVNSLTNEARFFVDLLSLPGYGTYQHSYEDMLARHDELIPLLGDRVTVIHLGQDQVTEAGALYAELAGSAVPLSGESLDALRELADACTGMPVPEVKVAENLAVINAVRVRQGAAPSVRTATDVLRLAAALSGSDVTLTTPPKFASFPRAQRRLLAAALRHVGRSDVPQRAEQFKRLAERIHPHEYPAAAEVFAVARGEVQARSLASVAEYEFRSGRADLAARVLLAAPGMLWRAADRILRESRPGMRADALYHLEASAPRVSGRVLLGVREHLMNRARKGGAPRVFVNRRGRAWVTGDPRVPLDEGAVRDVLGVIDAEVLRRLPDTGTLVIDPAIAGAALPLSGKGTPDGLGVWPRGSVIPVGGDLLRFFVYWKQRSQRTDFDLSALLTDEQFGNMSHVSWTSYHADGAVYSGDITDATNGATEFIDITLGVRRGYVIPQVYVYSGEGFSEVEENFFGFMTREGMQAGAPFEARTVRMKGALAGEHRTAMPLVFYRGEDGKWYAKWVHLYLRGALNFFGGAQVEDNKVTTAGLARGIMEREYLRVGYIAEALKAKAQFFMVPQLFADGGAPEGSEVTYIGIEQPEGLPRDARVFTLENLGSLVPA